MGAANFVNGRLDLEAWLRDRGVRFRKKPKPGDGQVVYELEHCPFNPNHRLPDAAFFQATDTGRPGFKCHHDSCSHHNWQSASEQLVRPEARHYVSSGQIGLKFFDRGPTDRGVQEFEGLHSREFFSKVYTQDYLIGGLVAAGQNLLIGGPEKCLKTSLSIDMILSLGSGTPFLGTFPVEGKKPCVIFSGESGAPALQDTARRVAEARGIDPAETEVTWYFDLPKVSQLSHLRGLEKIIRDTGAEMLMIDPAYLCLLAGGKSDASNIFDMGQVLADFSSVAGDTGCTMALVHHFKKGDPKRGFAKPELQDLSHAGFSAFARQWMLLSRRSAFTRSLGLHELYLVTGGSSGHGGDYALDVEEGTNHDHINGRHWNVSISDLQEWEQDVEAGESLSNSQDAAKTRQRVVSAFSSDERPMSLSRLKARSGVTDQVALRYLLDSMVESGELVVTRYRGAQQFALPGTPAAKLLEK